MILYANVRACGSCNVAAAAGGDRRPFVFELYACVHNFPSTNTHVWNKSLPIQCACEVFQSAQPVRYDRATLTHRRCETSECGAATTIRRSQSVFLYHCNGTHRRTYARTHTLWDCCADASAVHAYYVQYGSTFFTPASLSGCSDRNRARYAIISALSVLGTIWILEPLNANDSARHNAQSTYDNVRVVLPPISLLFRFGFVCLRRALSSSYRFVERPNRCGVDSVECFSSHVLCCSHVLIRYPLSGTDCLRAHLHHHCRSAITQQFSAIIVRPSHRVLYRTDRSMAA